MKRIISICGRLAALAMFLTLSVLAGPRTVRAQTATSTAKIATSKKLAVNPNLDSDGDGLPDVMEAKFKTDPLVADTDHDGFPDGVEIKNGYDPLHGGGAKLSKKIEVSIKKQKLDYFLGGVELGEFTVSTGSWNHPTPTGNFTVQTKSPRARSAKYKLWMPYWLGLGASGIGIHELPEWDSGYQESAAHLGTPVSHGCVRLGVGSAKTLYDWTPVGTPVEIR